MIIFFLELFLITNLKIDAVFQVDKPDNKANELSFENILSSLRNNLFVDLKFFWLMKYLFFYIWTYNAMF